jgi:hypothetical protein
LQEYVRCYSAPNAMGCRFEYYRAITDNLNHNQEAIQTKLKMPVLAFGGETATGMGMFNRMPAGAEDVRGSEAPLFTFVVTVEPFLAHTERQCP